MLKFANKKGGEKGDTLIEVLFAITVFSFIVVSSLGLMNQGLSASQRALEITTVRQTMDGQAEVLRFLHDSYVQAYYTGATFAAGSPADQYNKILQHVTGFTTATTFGGTAACKIAPDSAHDFILNPVTATMVTGSAKFEKATTYAQLTYSSGNALDKSQGIWIEGVRSADDSGSRSGYTDFHIMACWDGPGASTPMHLGTIVRLYEPRG